MTGLMWLVNCFLKLGIVKMLGDVIACQLSICSVSKKNASAWERCKISAARYKMLKPNVARCQIHMYNSIQRILRLDTWKIFWRGEFLGAY